MGTVRKLRSKYTGPSHPWEAERLEQEKKLTKNYGLKNKKEIWKITSKLRSYKNQAKKLIARTDEQAKKEEKLLITKLIALGILNETATLDTILEINIEKLLNRRLQTIVMLKGLARTVSQSRQMITHGHIAIKNQKVNVPSYLVKTAEEIEITYFQNSNFNDSEHPELAIKKKEEIEKVDVKEIKPKHKMKKIEEKPTITEKTTVEKEPTKIEAPTKETATPKEVIKPKEIKSPEQPKLEVTK
jgi:small subunit ribosomal protein S4